MNCNQSFIEKLRCPDYHHSSKQSATLNCPPKYSQSFIMNQMVNKPRMLRNQYSIQKYSSTDELNEHIENPKVMSLTISQMRNLRPNSVTPEKRSEMVRYRSREIKQQHLMEPSDKKRSKTYHVNSLAKTALLYVNRQESRMKLQEYSQNDIKLIDILQSTQQTLQPDILKTTNSRLIDKCELTFHSQVSVPTASLSLQIEYVKLYVSEINNYNVKWSSQDRITKNIPKKLHEKYATSDNISLFLESSRFKIEENFNSVYKHGKYRWLYPGEEAAIIDGIQQYLECCTKKIALLMITLNKILKQIITSNRLEYLLNYPICMKQIEAHWKIMATQFKLKQLSHKYRNQITNKLWKEIQGSKTLFLDLHQDNNLLVEFVKQN